MLKNMRKIAVFVVILCTAVLMFTSSVFGMGNHSVESAVTYTDNEDLQNRMALAVETYPSAFLDENGEGIEFGGATDCLAYARWLYNQLFDMMDFTNMNVPGYNLEYRFDNGTIRETKTAAQMKFEFESLNVKFGSMIFFDPSCGSSAEHAMIVLTHNEDGVIVIHGSWGGKGLIRVTEFTWSEMITNFGQLAWVRTPWNYPGEETVIATSMKIIGPDAVHIGVDENYTASFEPENVSNDSVIWSVENVTGQASIDRYGKLTATKCGLVRITATARDGSNLSCTKTVRIGKISDVLNLTSSVKEGNTVILNWEKCPNASGYTVYRSDKPTGNYMPISTISNGNQTTYKETVENGTYYYKISSYEVHYGNITVGEKCLFVSATAKAPIHSKGGNF